MCSYVQSMHPCTMAGRFEVHTLAFSDNILLRIYITFDKWYSERWLNCMYISGSVPKSERWRKKWHWSTTETSDEILSGLVFERSCTIDCISHLLCDSLVCGFITHTQDLTKTWYFNSIINWCEIWGVYIAECAW